MPHVIVKMFPGRTEDQKKALAEQITRALMETIKCTDGSISVAVEEVSSEEWMEKVYKPHIQEKKETLYKQPGY